MAISNGTSENIGKKSRMYGLFDCLCPKFVELTSIPITIIQAMGSAWGVKKKD